MGESAHVLQGASFHTLYAGMRYVSRAQIRPRKDRLFTETELSRYDGSDPSLPVLLGLDGIVFDVSANRLTYGRHGAYNHFAGRDAARAFVTGCFKTHLTHDTRGFTQDQRNVRHPSRVFACFRTECEATVAQRVEALLLSAFLIPSCISRSPSDISAGACAISQSWTSAA